MLCRYRGQASERRERRGRERGFTLIELMIVVAIIGVLAAIAVPKFLEYMQKSKSTEAVLNLNAIAKAAESAYLDEQQFPQVGSAQTPAQRCCAQPGRKCAVVANEWRGVIAWDTLGFEMTESFYFQYRYTALGPDQYEATAVGDLDCDGTPFTFTMDGVAVDGTPSSTLTRPNRSD